MNVRLPIWLLSGAPTAAPSPTRLHYPVAHWIAGLGTPRRPFVLQPPFPIAQWIACGGGLAGPVPPGPVYQTFLEAIRKTLLADAPLTTLARGGYWHRYAPPNVPRPYVVFSVINFLNDGVGGPHYIQSGQLKLTAYATPSSLANTIANAATRLLSDTGLSWSDGRLMMFRSAAPPSPDRPNLDFGGSRLQGETRIFDYMLSGRFDS